MNPTAAILVIGDEILSGRTREGNAHHLAGRLAAQGITLTEIRVVPDDHDKIIAAVRALSEDNDHLFTSGGIGPTHDDITAEAVAGAFGLDAPVREDARALLQAHYDARGQELNAARLRMARIPPGATLIANPVSTAPGFTLHNVHVLAGVPSVFSAMLDGLLPGLGAGQALQSETLRLEHGEGDIAEALAALASEMPDLSFGSYPFQVDGRHGTNLVVRGTEAARVAEGYAALHRIAEALA